MTEKNEDNKDDIENKDGEEKDILDELLDGVGDDADDESEEDNNDDSDADDKGADDKPVSMKELKKLLESSGKGGANLDKFKTEMIGTMKDMLTPLLAGQKQTELKKTVSDFEVKVKAELPGFEVDMDLFEYHLSSGKKKQDALKIQVDAEKKRAKAYGFEKEEGSDGYDSGGDPAELKDFDPTYHKENAKEFKKLPKDERQKYFTKLANFVRSNKKR
jgi:hypothetical protein